ncbi:MAG: carbohydrate ABC transporter permease [Actinomycetota bacterium]|nr:carbohydrate ABC transporter permease [Actinomycetota bacterium]
MRISWPVRVVVYLVVAVAAFAVLFPLLWMFVSAFKSQSDIINPNSPIIPTHWQWSNIVTAWNAAPFGRFFINTAIFSLATTAGQIITGIIAGYAFAMFNFPGRQILFYGVLSGLMIPFTVVLVPVVQLLADFGWIDTYQGLIVPNIASALGCFLYRQFFLSAPVDLAESARLDGASEWRIFWTIYRPLAQPMTAALTTIVFLNNWNNFLFPLVVTSKESLMMVSQGLTIFQGQLQGTQYNLLMAGSLIAVVPVLIVALIAQRRVIDGLMIGATR